MMYIGRVLVVLSIICLVKCSENEFQDEVLSRSRRQLLFPNSTVLQFNAGIGTPTPIKTVNVNWAFQANFQLPWNRSQIPFDILEANGGYGGESRKKRDTEREGYNNDARLYHFYKYVEDVLNGFSYNGTACVLRTLCELGAEPIHTDHEDDLLHELATFVLNPENDKENHEFKESEPYILAYNEGKLHHDCHSLYSCGISLIDMFSKVHDQN
ncbi:unnamed protein product [Colias eurytheme]|nr:unnamed protein product [Colias eurytheme]